MRKSNRHADYYIINMFMAIANNFRPIILPSVLL